MDEKLSNSSAETKGEKTAIQFCSDSVLTKGLPTP